MSINKSSLRKVSFGLAFSLLFMSCADNVSQPTTDTEETTASAPKQAESSSAPSTSSIAATSTKAEATAITTSETKPSATISEQKPPQEDRESSPITKSAPTTQASPLTIQEAVQTTSSSQTKKPTPQASTTTKIQIWIERSSTTYCPPFQPRRRGKCSPW